MENFIRNKTSKVPIGQSLNERQIRARILQEEIGRDLAKRNPEIVKHCTDLKSYKSLTDIGRMYLPNVHSDGVVRHAVAYALEQLMDEEDLKNLQKERKRRALEHKFGSFDSEAFRKRCRDARKRKAELGIETDVTKLIRGRGLTPYSAEERQAINELTRNEDYQITSGAYRGKPDYELIALELNIRFHDCKGVRTKSSVGHYVRDKRRKKSTK